MTQKMKTKILAFVLVLSQATQFYMIQRRNASDWATTPTRVSAQANRAVVQIRTDVAMGAGSIIDERGYILTCQHVIASSTSGVVTVNLYNNSAAFVGKVVWQDPDKDLALVKIDAPVPLPVLRVAKELPQIGELVLTIGHPFGASWSVGSGIVSKFIPSKDVNFIQHTALTHPGNSGGPLLNMRGEIVGVDARTIQMTPFYTPLGLNMAIDGNAIRQFLREAEHVVAPSPEITTCTDL